MADPLGRFLDEARMVRGTLAGTPETPYYPGLSNLFNSIGAGLRPQVSAVMTLKNMGAGMPDGGFFTQDQFDRKTHEVTAPLTPSRGVVEVKAPSDPVDDIAASAQIGKYWNRYKLVLVTNLRDWLLLGERNGKRVELERFTLATSESAFWAMTANATKVNKQQGEVFADFLARVLRHWAPLSEPQDLAWFLASYARDARHRIEFAPATGVKQLTALKTSLEKALGVDFKEGKGEHFFHSTLVQTLFYGMFAAWVLKHREGVQSSFDWKSAAWYLRVPMIDALFGQLAMPTRLKALNLEQVLDWAADALNRVDQAGFFAKFDASHSVQYFYEPFLEAFDPELRKELGVWYTPTEIVRYMVARVDAALQTELGLVDGLADPNVIVLDACCGTGAFLVEVLGTIERRLKAKGEAALMAHDLKEAATTRLFGFELLPAPFVIAHLQLGLLLLDAGAPLGTLPDGSHERAGVYLTNALTGWEPLSDPKTEVLPFPEFAEERDAADAVKQSRKVLVILGNPPYNGYAGVATGEERTLTDAYRHAEHGPQPQGHGLNELYVRFFRMAERQIVDRTGHGVICFVSNNSWLDGLSHPAMRERFMQVFDSIRIDNLHGDKFRNGKLTPDGKPDPSAFSTPQNRDGIQVGTAVATLVRQDSVEHTSVLRHRDWWGVTKLADLLAAASELDALAYRELEPHQVLGSVFGGSASTSSYLAWPRIIELFPCTFSAVQTKRDDALVDVVRGDLEARMTTYLDPAASEVTLREAVPVLMRDSNRFAYNKVRADLIKAGFNPAQIHRYVYRPFDTRWVYWEPETKLLGEKSPDYFAQVFPENSWIFTTGRTRKDLPEPPYATRLLADLNLLDSGARGIPLKVRHTHDDLLGAKVVIAENISDDARSYLTGLDASAEVLFFHTLAILSSPLYREENSSALRADWPRIPLPDEAALRASAALGMQLQTFFDTESALAGVTAGQLQPLLAATGVITTDAGGALKPSDFALTAGWGFAGKGGITMPGRGKAIKRASDADELKAGGAAVTYDIWLNDVAYWRNVPASAWEFTLGGYQVLKKWLSYREKAILGRALTVAEVREATALIRRLTSIVSLYPQLDANYRVCAQDVLP